MLWGCEEDNTVRLVFAELDGDIHGVTGFTCLQLHPPLPVRYLAQRLSRMREPRLSFAVDIHPLSGFPDCRSTELGTFCADNDCNPAPNARQCYPAALPPGSIARANALAVVTDAVHALADTVVTEEAPDGPVIVRVVATTQPCSALESAGGTLHEFDPTLLVGCAHTCPTVLDDVRGDLLMSLEGSPVFCEDSVLVCASGDFDPSAVLTPDDPGGGGDGGGD